MSQKQVITLSNHKQHPYQLVLSKRAKRLSIKLSQEGELKVVLPQGIPVAQAHHFVQQKAAWVEKHLSKQSRKSKPIVTPRPDVLSLQMLGEEWAVEYVANGNQSIEYHDDRIKQCLTISGAIDSEELVHKIIGLFLKNKASVIFPKIMNEIAAQHGFHFNGFSIRGQKSRWGSCSSRKNINLNYKLLFMPEQTARYVFIHELCHTHEMNNSAKFWRLVKQCDPNYRQHEQYLKDHGSIIRHF